MTDILTRARLILNAAAIAGLITFAAPASAQQPGSIVDPQANVLSEQLCFDKLRALKD